MQRQNQGRRPPHPFNTQQLYTSSHLPFFVGFVFVLFSSNMASHMLTPNCLALLMISGVFHVIRCNSECRIVNVFPLSSHVATWFCVFFLVLFFCLCTGRGPTLQLNVKWPPILSFHCLHLTYI